MKSIYHGNWHTSVHMHREKLYGKSSFLSTGMECKASLLVNTTSFRIEKARWEVSRGASGPVQAEINGLNGVEAYLGSGKALRRAVLNEHGKKALELVSETVKGFIQAGTFLYKERGYSTPEEYDNYWERMYLNSCRYFSNLDRIAVRWEQHIAGQKRFGCLFNRFKMISLALDGDALMAVASMTDSFHEVGLRMTLDRLQGTVIAADCHLLRGPDPVCFEAGSFMDNLCGRSLYGISKKELAALMGGGQGCIHMIDLCYDLSTIFQEERGQVFC